MGISLETKRIGLIDFEPTVLALGCWAFGGTSWGGQDDQDSIGAIAAALEAGINHFDTATDYDKSETVLGQQLKAVRQKVFIATKGAAADKAGMLEAVDASLRHLGTDVIDLFYIHWPNSGVDLRNTMEGLQQARQAGKIRGIGVSNFSVEQMQQVMEVGSIDANQLCYNLFWRQGEDDVIPFCRQHNIAVVTYSSIAQGILAGKFGPKPTFPPFDMREHVIFFQENVWPHIYQGVEQLKQLAAEVGRPLVHLAIRWVARQPGITSVLVGARNDKQLHTNVEAMAGEIDESIFERMTAISDQVAEHIPARDNLWDYKP